MWWVYILIGTVGGIIAGMGMGGGTLTIPLLTIFTSLGQKTAQGINLLAFVPMAIVAIIIHASKHMVKFKKTYMLAIIGAVFSVGSSFLVKNIDDILLKRIFAIFLIILSMVQFAGLFKKKPIK